MNRIIRSRLSIIAVVLIVPLALMGCRTCWECQYECEANLCPRICSGDWGCTFTCLGFCLYRLCALPCALTKASQYYEDNSDDCTTTFEQFQLAAIQFCEEYPEECQQAFDTWPESFDEEGSK